MSAALLSSEVLWENLLLAHLLASGGLGARWRSLACRSITHLCYITWRSPCVSVSESPLFIRTTAYWIRAILMTLFDLDYFLISK